MFREVMGQYAVVFRESDWLVRTELLYLLAVPALLLGFAVCLSARW
jgi:hypothetical protein